MLGTTSPPLESWLRKQARTKVLQASSWANPGFSPVFCFLHHCPGNSCTRYWQRAEVEYVVTKGTRKLPKEEISWYLACHLGWLSQGSNWKPNDWPEESWRREVKKVGRRKEGENNTLQNKQNMWLCVLEWEGLDRNEGKGNMFLEEGKMLLA